MAATMPEPQQLHAVGGNKQPLCTAAYNKLPFIIPPTTTARWKHIRYGLPSREAEYSWGDEAKMKSCCSSFRGGTATVRLLSLHENQAKSDNGTHCSETQYRLS